MYKTNDQGEHSVFDSGMHRDTQENKPRYDLIYPPMLKRWAELMGRGADKYSERNWEKANSEEELQRFYSAAFRHLMQWLYEEDEEDHASAIMFNIAGAEMVKSKLKKDD